MIYLFEPHALHASSYLLKIPCHIFISWHEKLGGEHRHLSMVQRVRKQPSNDILFSVWCFILLTWICVEIEDCTRRTISFEAASVWGGCGFKDPLLPWSVNREPFTPPLICHISLLTEKKYSSPFSPVHPEIHPPIPCILFIYHISVPISYLHFHLKSTVLYIYYDYTNFFLLWMFLCCTPILFGSLLVALMWNVCAEPIECCVYIKATLFLTTPAFVVWVWLHETKKKVRGLMTSCDTTVQKFKYTLTRFNQWRDWRLGQEIRLNIMKTDHF